MGTFSVQPNTRRVSANIGMAVSLASLAMVFATFLFAYGIVRSKAAVWPPLDAAPLPLGLAWLNTLVLVASSVTWRRGQRELERGEAGAFNHWLAFTLGLGVLFLGLQATLWGRMHADGLSLGGTQYEAFLFFLTIFHAVHIVAGLGVLLALVPGALGHRLHPHGLTRVRLSGMFWHFLDVAWLAIFLTVFLI